MGRIDIRRRVAPGLAQLLAVTALLVSGTQGALGQGGSAAAQPPEHHGAHHRPQPEPGGQAVPEDLPSIPDVRLRDQNGDELDFYSDLVAGKVVAMNFVFTTCTTVCAPMGAIFGQLRRDLGARAGRDVHLVSVSVDPVTDTPQRLAAWSKRFGAGPGWTLVTGDKLEVDKLLKALEVFTPDFAEHSPTVLVGNDRADYWQRAYGLAPAAKLAELIDRAAAARGRRDASP